MRKFLYIDSKNRDCPVLISAKRKPSEKNIPRSGAWVVREWYSRSTEIDCYGRDIPCFPEITWGRLKELTFVGELKNES